ncbi:MAG: hypothetical protein LBC96_07075 [Lachnospiraceae bacterium]|nr:hypothetical protein [Lachnospiraceae bacterium]
MKGKLYNKTTTIYILLAVYSLVLLLFTTHSSPLFPFNGWNDINIFFTVGKGFVRGYVPYVDLIDHKGPFLFLLFGVASLIQKTGYLGLFLLQVIALTISSIYVFRIASLFIRRAEMSFLVAIICPLFLLLRSFEGGRAEDFVLTMFTVSLYYFTLYFVNDSASSKSGHVICQGVLFAMVFMIKFNLVLFFLGFIIMIIFDLLQKREYRQLWRYIVLFLGGVGMVILPFLLYLLITGSFGAFYEVYFKISFIQASGVYETFWDRLVSSLYITMISFRIRMGYTLTIALGFLFVLIKMRNEEEKKNGRGHGWFQSLKKQLKVYFTPYFIAYGLSFALLVFSIYIGGALLYSCIPISVFAIMGVIAICAWLEIVTEGEKISKVTKGVAVFSVLLILIMVKGAVFEPAFMHRQMPVQIKMAELIHQYASDGNPTLLQVDALDSGFYTASGIIPQEPYFCTINVSYEQYPQLFDSLQEAVRQGRNEFVIIHTYNEHERPNEEYWRFADHYQHIAVLHGAGSVDTRWYHLYQRY